MDQFIKKFGEALDRRSFFRGMGKLGMAAAAVAGGVLVPRAAEADACLCSDKSGGGNNSNGKKNPCNGLTNGATCYSNGSGAVGTCVEQTAGKCDCRCVISSGGLGNQLCGRGSSERPGEVGGDRGTA